MGHIGLLSARSGCFSSEVSQNFPFHNPFPVSGDLKIVYTYIYIYINIYIVTKTAFLSVVCCVCSYKRSCTLTHVDMSIRDLPTSMCRLTSIRDRPTSIRDRPTLIRVNLHRPMLHTQPSCFPIKGAAQQLVFVIWPNTVEESTSKNWSCSLFHLAI